MNIDHIYTYVLEKEQQERKTNKRVGIAKQNKKTLNEIICACNKDRLNER